VGPLDFSQSEFSVLRKTGQVACAPSGVHMPTCSSPEEGEHMPTTIAPKNMVSVHLSTQNQSLDHLKKVIEYLAKQAGCGACGRLTHLDLTFHGDPPEAIAQLGVLSINQR
jgi:hypothetical protein